MALKWIVLIKILCGIRGIQNTTQNLRRYSNIPKFDSLVTKAEWKSEEGIYEVSIRQANGSIKTDWCHTLINCSGILKPKIPGLKSFKGPMLHSANWDPKVDYTGKKVGLIGVRSSGIQITPRVQKVASSLEVFIRSPVATPDHPYLTDLLVRGQEPFGYTEAEKNAFEKDPEILLTFRRSLELGICDATDFCKIGSEKQAMLFKTCKENMERVLSKKPELMEELIPKFAVGCWRPTPGAGFLEALVSENARAVFSPIQEVAKKGIKTADGEVHEFDVIICATGFEIEISPFFEINGKGGITMNEAWESERKANQLERNLDNFITLMMKMQSEGIKSMEPSQRATDEFAAHAEEWHKDTVWTEPCNSWYKRGGPNGRPYIWCGSIPAYMKTMSNIRFEDGEYEYAHGNRFAYLGNGKVVADSFPRTERLKYLVPHVRNGNTPWEIE
ncbi:hypothetical protein K432DRAFT_406216 [Lepidopterella palustris CBS 459.81]|uniref:FAD/NAD(P)-binding domain-containing protein n=1 Tax=Lepidopterella palustris CBS 459.81 TaxID=1314670 RepID=A0A8E2JDN6_9PEZI|nr:hypothetical protein K432DRAFT_406216 [Lepidopterella palustris CBS 459.81]